MEEAKALFKTALRASDPVVFLEHKALFAAKGEVPVGEYLLPFGQANIVRPGKDITVVSCGLYLHRSLEAAKTFQLARLERIGQHWLHGKSLREAGFAVP